MMYIVKIIKETIETLHFLGNFMLGMLSLITAPILLLVLIMFELSKTLVKNYIS